MTHKQKLSLVLLVILIGSLASLQHTEKPKNAKALIKWPVNPIPTYHTSWVTIYHPTQKECGWNKNITATGKPGEVGICAVSQKLLDYYVNFTDTVQVLTGSLKGKYVVTDKAGSKGKLIDIWRPVCDSVSDCYKCKFKVIKNNN